MRQLGTGTTILSGNNSFSGPATISAGRIVFSNSGSQTLSGAISGGGNLTMAGTGTTIFSGSNTYSGTTLVSAGTLQANSTNAFGTGAVTLNNTGILALSMNLTISSLVWSAGASTVAISNLTNGAYLNITGALSLSGSGTGTFDLTGNTLGTNSIELMAWGSSNSYTTNNFLVTGISSYSLNISSNALWITPINELIAVTSNTIVSNTATYPSVTFQTNGILTITPSAVLTITANVVASNSGTVNLNGVLNTPALVLPQNSFLRGTGTLNGNLTNSGGTIAPGNGSPGTLTVNGNYVQTSGGSLQIQVANGGNSFLTVNGIATLGGTLVVSSYGGHQFQYGEEIPFLSATSISGSFSSVEVPSGFRARVKVVGDPVLEVILAPLSYTQLAANRNQSNVATALNSFIPYTSGDQLVISTSLDSLTASEYNQAFNAIMPTFYQQIATIAFNEANALNMELNQRLWGVRLAEGGGFSMSGLADNYPMIQEGQGDGSGKGVLDSKKDILRPGLDNHWGMFLDGNGIFAQANSANMLPGYNSESGGITTGLTYKWNDKVASGIYAGYQGTYTKSGANGSGLGTGSSLTDNAVRFGVFGTYGNKDGKGLYLNGLAGGAYHNYQATRVIQYTGVNRTANSQPGAGELDTMLATGYDIQKGKFTFGPTASLQYTYLGVNSLNETGAQSLNYNSGGWNSSSMLSSVGAHAAYNWIAHHGSGGDIVVVPQINLNWQHEFMQNPYDISGNLGGTSPTFSNWSAAPIRDFLYTGVGFTVDIGKRWNTSFFYNAAAGNQNLTSQNIFWSAGVKF
jgi:autotransporter-associated beta strand protein